MACSFTRQDWLVDCANVAGLWASSLVDVTDDPRALDAAGRWAVVLPFEGPPCFARFANWSTEPPAGLTVGRWRGPSEDAWTSSMDAAHYQAAVEATRQAIAAGTVFQANVCRVLQAPLSDDRDLLGLHLLLAARHPAPHASFIRVEAAGVDIASASPELFLERRGPTIRTSPIKGTGRTPADLLPKDEAENVMIVDLMRNDLSRVCTSGSVEVPALLRLEAHPGLVHLVSDVVGQLREGIGWAQIVDATFPPGSVTGAPKSSALTLIDRLEPASRQVYCGALGWVDADERTASLAVAIRTFWRDEDTIKFGTGAGITWGSDPRGEWHETELKAHRLLQVASGVWQGGLP